MVDEYRNMTMEGMDLIPLESNLHEYDPVIISQIINMIQADNSWHQKTFRTVMSVLWNMWMEVIRELENTSMHGTNNYENNVEMDQVEVIDLCSVTQNKNKAHVKQKESTKQESHDKTKLDTTDRMEIKLRTKKSMFMTKNGEVKFVMMC